MSCFLFDNIKPATKPCFLISSKYTTIFPKKQQRGDVPGTERLPAATRTKPVRHFANKAANAMEFNFASTLSPREDNTLGAVAPTKIAPWRAFASFVFVL